MKYQARIVPTLAIQLDMGITYEKWGGTQQAKAGDWMLSKNGETYTCNAVVFAETYRDLPNTRGAAWFYKHAEIEAVEVIQDGYVKTLEGRSKCTKGDYIVTNPGGDQYVIAGDKFSSLYTEADSQ